MLTTGASRLSAEVRQVVDWALLPPPDEEMEDVSDVDELADGGFSVVVDERNDTERRAELMDDDGEPPIADVRLLDRIRLIVHGVESGSGSPGSTIFKTGKCCCCCCEVWRNWLLAAALVVAGAINSSCCC